MRCFLMFTLEHNKLKTSRNSVFGGEHKILKINGGEKNAYFKIRIYI